MSYLFLHTCVLGFPIVQSDLVACHTVHVVLNVFHLHNLHYWFWNIGAIQDSLLKNIESYSKLFKSTFMHKKNTLRDPLVKLNIFNVYFYLYFEFVQKSKVKKHKILERSKKIVVSLKLKQFYI